MEVTELYQLDFTQNKAHFKFFIEYKHDILFT